MATSNNGLKGSFPPIITPFKDGAIDFDMYASLVEFQIKQGSHGILVNGTTSEPSTLTVEERNKIVDLAVKTNKGRLPLVVATGSQSLAETVALTDHAVKAGADCLLIVTPYYIRPNQRGLIEYYLEVTKKHKTPWMIYHIPGRAAVSITLDTVKELRERSSTFIGMKHAVDNLGFVSKCLDAWPEYKVFVGLEDLSFPMMCVGAVGLMNAVGNLRPDLMAELCELVFKGELKKAQALHMRLFEINEAVFYDNNPIPMKYMMKKLGIIKTNEHRLPNLPATPELEQRLDGVLKRAGFV
jgi:4-hydroxy-tetrahydrodipicolinate synthase